jgi:hypothetical protein
LAIIFILAGDRILDSLFGNNQGLVIPDQNTSTALPPRTPSPNATKSAAALTSATSQIESPFPTRSPVATSLEVVITSELTQSINCTYTIHFWKVYPNTWRIEKIVLGERSYTKAQAIAILNIEDPNLATTRLLQQYITTLLNTLKGADPRGITRTMDRVNEWLILHPPEKGLTQAESLEGDTFADELEDFNLGVTGPGRCINEPLTPTPGATPTPINYTPPATATFTPRPFTPVAPRTATPTKKPGGPPKPTQPPTTAPTKPPPPPATNTSKPPTPMPTPSPRP